MEGTSDNIFNLFFDSMVVLLLGYYDGVIFHRIVPGFLVQTGDRTGTGGGGESFYGDWFEDEIHPRLRFAHRGLVAMAETQYLVGLKSCFKHRYLADTSL